MTARTKFLFLFLLAGCENTEYCVPMDNNAGLKIYEIWIDEECEDEVIESAVEAADLLNQFSCRMTDGYVITIVGTTHASHDSYETNNDVPTLACHAEPVDLPREIVGHTVTGKSVDLYNWTVPGATYQYYLKLVLHEMTHFVGVQGHAPNNDSVMAPSMRRMKTKFTADDEELFCAFFECSEDSK